MNEKERYIRESEWDSDDSWRWECHECGYKAMYRNAIKELRNCALCFDLTICPDCDHCAICGYRSEVFLEG